MAWYVLTYGGCWKRFDEPASPGNPWTWVGAGGAAVIMEVMPDSLYFSINPDWRGPSDPAPSPICETTPTGGVNFPRLYKPSWLANFLAACNWQVFTWYINPGEYIEDAIDWVLDKINDLLATGENIADKALEAWETLKGIWGDISDFVDRQLSRIEDTLEDWGDRLDGLFNTVKDWARDQIDDIYQFIQQTYTSLAQTIELALGRIEDFFTYTLPNLIDRITLDDILLARLGDVWDTLNRLTDIVDAFRDFFDDPELWLLERIKSMLARFI